MLYEMFFYNFNQAIIDSTYSIILLIVLKIIILLKRIYYIFICHWDRNSETKKVTFPYGRNWKKNWWGPDPWTPSSYDLAPPFVNMSLKCMCCAFSCSHNIIVSILYDISSPFAGPARELKWRTSAYNIRTRVQRK